MSFNDGIIKQGYKSMDNFNKGKKKYKNKWKQMSVYISF